MVLDPLVDKTAHHHNDIREQKRLIEAMQRHIEEMDRSLKVDLNLKSFLIDIKKRQALIVS